MQRLSGSDLDKKSQFAQNLLKSEQKLRSLFTEISKVRPQIKELKQELAKYTDLQEEALSFTQDIAAQINDFIGEQETKFGRFKHADAYIKWVDAWDNFDGEATEVDNYESEDGNDDEIEDDDEDDYNSVTDSLDLYEYVESLPAMLGEFQKTIDSFCFAKQLDSLPNGVGIRQRNDLQTRKPSLQKQEILFGVPGFVQDVPPRPQPIVSDEHSEESTEEEPSSDSIVDPFSKDYSE